MKNINNPEIPVLSFAAFRESLARINQKPETVSKNSNQDLNLSAVKN